MAEDFTQEPELTEQAETKVTEGPEIDLDQLGVYAPWDYSDQPFANLSKDAKAALLELDLITDKSDVAARRWEVEQCWRALHYDRGYQRLFKGRSGGWVLPGQSMGNGRSAPGHNSTRQTNFYTPAGDIVCSALTLAACGASLDSLTKKIS